MRLVTPIAKDAWNARFIHRKQLSGRANVHQLERSEHASAPVVRQGELDLQETYSRRAARAVRHRTSPLEAVASVDSGGISNASTHRRYGRLRLGALDSLLGSRRLDWAECGSAGDARQTGD